MTIYHRYSARRFISPSSRHHVINDDCPEDKREDYQNCSVLCCVRLLCTVIRTHVEERTRNSSGDEIANVNFFYDDIVHVEASAYTPIEPTS